MTGVNLDFVLAALALSALVAWAILPPLRAFARRRTSLAIAVLSAVGLFAAAFGLYAWVRTPYPLAALEGASVDQRRARERLMGLKEAAAATPDDPRPWRELGDLYLVRGAYPQSAEAYRRATLLSSADPVTLLAYVRAQILAADGTVSEEAERGLNLLATLARDLPPLQSEIRAYQALREAQRAPSEATRQTLSERLDDPAFPPFLRRMLVRAMENAKQ